MLKALFQEISSWLRAFFPRKAKRHTQRPTSDQPTRPSEPPVLVRKRLKLPQDVLKRAVPGLSDPQRWVGPLNKALDEFDIRDKREIALFLAHLGHESADFKSLRENMNYSVEGLIATFGSHRISTANAQKYGRTPDQEANQPAIANQVYGKTWGRKNLGNTGPNDGWDYRAGGPIGLTGRANYRAAGDAIKEPLEDMPTIITDPTIGARVAAWYWTTRVKPENRQSLVAATRDINGGLNGLDDRKTRFIEAAMALGVKV